MSKKTMELTTLPGQRLPPDDSMDAVDATTSDDNRNRSSGATIITDTTSPSTTTTTTTTTTRRIFNKSIQKKIILLLPLLLCLYMLTDDNYYRHPQSRYYYNDANYNDSNYNDSNYNDHQHQHHQHHLAFITALSRHPPSLRVFRIISESAFLLFCTAFALWVWEGIAATTTTTTSSVGSLLFGPPPDGVTSNAAYVVYAKHGARLLSRRHRRRRRYERRRRGIINDNDDDNDENDDNDDAAEMDNFDCQQQQQPQVPQPPSSTSVMGAALDLSILTCMFLIFFTISSAEGGRYIDQHQQQSTNNAIGEIHLYSPLTVEGGSSSLSSLEEGGGGDDGDIENNENNNNSNSNSNSNHDNNNNNNNNNYGSSWMAFFANIAAPLFPLTLFAISIVMVIIPWRKRKVLWTIVSLTVGAPFYEVTFRDGFIGDILTSTVRPLQDLAFTIFFLPLGLRAWWSSHTYTFDAAAIPMERSWLLHTVLLPACTLSPLWWRFLQNLRQCFDSKQRWPYLGNAFKYLLAAEVATFAMYDPSVKKHPVWIACFFIATMYQVWWDVFMDWGLLERDSSFGYHHSSIKSNQCWRWWPYSLRSKRLYRWQWVYYLVFGINFCLRFVGMFTLIPPVYLSRTTGLIVNTYNPDFQLFLGSLAASAEIFRRTIWALLRLEWEVIKTAAERQKSTIAGVSSASQGRGNSNDDILLQDEEDMKPMPIDSSNNGARRRLFSLASTTKESISLASLSDMSNLNDIQILSELCVWATIFSGIAIIAAAHREVL